MEQFLVWASPFSYYKLGIPDANQSIGIYQALCSMHLALCCPYRCPCLSHGLFFASNRRPSLLWDILSTWGNWSGQTRNETGGNRSKHPAPAARLVLPGRGSAPGLLSTSHLTLLPPGGLFHLCQSTTYISQQQKSSRCNWQTAAEQPA